MYAKPEKAGLTAVTVRPPVNPGRTRETRQEKAERETGCEGRSEVLLGLCFNFPKV